MADDCSDPLRITEENDVAKKCNKNDGFKDPLSGDFDTDDLELELESLDLNASMKSDVEVDQFSRSSSAIAAYRSDEMDWETKDLFVIVDNPEKHTSAMESYITFRINTKTTRAEFDNHEYCVRRRYNDFLWLRQKLEEAHPTHLVPPLPEKNSFKQLDRFSEDFVKMRQGALQKFLLRLSDHPVLSFNKHFQVFITAKSSEFQSHKKQKTSLITRMADSIHNMSAAYLMKNRPPEFDAMQEYMVAFSEKLAVLDRVSQRIIKEQTDYIIDLCSWGPMYTLWSNSEDDLSTALLAMSHTIDLCAASLRDVIDSTDDQFSQPFKEYMLYVEAVKAVLRRRDAIQMEYETCVEELNKRKDERDQLQTSEQAYSLSAFLGKDPDNVKQQKQEKLEQQIKQLTEEVDQSNDRIVCANADLKADMERWHRTKRKDLKDIFMMMCDRQIEYYESCLSSWEECIRALKQDDKPPAPPVEETTNKPGVSSLSAADSGHGSMD